MACTNSFSIRPVLAHGIAAPVPAPPYLPPSPLRDENSSQISTIGQESIARLPSSSEESFNQAAALIDREKLDEADTIILNMPCGKRQYNLYYKLGLTRLARREPGKAVAIASLHLPIPYQLTLFHDIATVLIPPRSSERELFVKKFLTDCYQKEVYPIKELIAQGEPIQAFNLLVRMDYRYANIEYMFEKLAREEYLKYDAPLPMTPIKVFAVSMMYKKIAKDLFIEGKFADLEQLTKTLPPLDYIDFFYEGIIDASIQVEDLEAAEKVTEKMSRDRIHRDYLLFKIDEARYAKKEGAIEYKSPQTRHKPQTSVWRECAQALIRKGELKKASAYTKLMPPRQFPECLLQAIALAWLAKGNLEEARTIAQTIPEGYEKEYVLEKIEEAEKKYTQTT